MKNSNVTKESINKVGEKPQVIRYQGKETTH
jgi:hypothetical protein